MRPPRTFRLVRRLKSDESGVAAIEFAIVAPLLMMLLFGTVTLFHAWREVQVDERATYTISDILSRYTELTNKNIEDVNLIFDKIIRHDKSPIRVTSVIKHDGKFVVQWCYAVAPYERMQNVEIPASKLPDVASGDSVIITETRSPRVPLTAFGGVKAGVTESFAAVRPRFVAAIAKTD